MLERSFFYAGGSFFNAGGPLRVPHPAFFHAAGCFSLCCTGLALILLGFGARSNPYPDPWEDPKVDSTTPVVRIIETLCGASSYAARFWDL